MTRVNEPCPLCERVLRGTLICANDLAVAFADGYPVSPGHTLVVPRRHVANFFSLSEDEQCALWSLVPCAERILTREHGPAGYNIGVNVGTAAGQTVAHVHLHLIPRYEGDRPDPRGGVRWVLPAKADYWSEEK